jgi:hypothetical protein
MENSDEFVEVMRRYDSTLVDLDDAIVFAIENSEQIDACKWIGKFHDGVFYSDTNGSQWFDGMTMYEAKMALSAQLLEALEG